MHAFNSLFCDITRLHSHFIVEYNFILQMYSILYYYHGGSLISAISVLGFKSKHSFLHSKPRIRSNFYKKNLLILKSLKVKGSILLDIRFLKLSYLKSTVYIWVTVFSGIVCTRPRQCWSPFRFHSQFHGILL